ncbi:hypothetical protein BLNAU_4450 [Blattamonas nauphoetae]|uniref:Uncharacterized protein n=1 Tax=Blattamonas nauphoetae TaxID=2049346 RepID=A0ABQ9Y9W7_9EUKA|nr:hypothetical protein BLNAU_4450 [Blattamonas nauphoetae]
MKKEKHLQELSEREVPPALSPDLVQIDSTLNRLNKAVTTIIFPIVKSPSQPDPEPSIVISSCSSESDGLRE